MCFVPVDTQRSEHKADTEKPIARARKRGGKLASGLQAITSDVEFFLSFTILLSVRQNTDHTSVLTLHHSIIGYFLCPSQICR
jgi:hypothetical protein